MVFDYIYQSVLEEQNLYYGEKEIFQRVKKDKESWTFGIPKEGIDNFLHQQGLELIEQMDSNKLEEKYFQDKKGNIVGNINGTHCIVYAKVRK